MTLRTHRNKSELAEPVFTWCPWLTSYWAAQRQDRLGCQENGLGQVRTIILVQGQPCYGEWEDRYRPTTLRQTLNERHRELCGRKPRNPMRQVLTLVKGGVA